MEHWLSVLRNIFAAAMLVPITASVAQAQEDAAAALQQLHFLAGTWTCNFQTSKGPGSQDVVYEFSPDGLWMTETSKLSKTGAGDWAIQVWGYDRHLGKFVAYNFAANGVYTKTVEGWVNGELRSRRDDNGLVVILKPVNSKSMSWVVESTEGAQLASETCIKLK